MVARVYRQAKSVFEWGLGESTMIASAVGVPRFLGIDSDPQWVNATRAAVNAPHFRFLLADVGETEDWGYPKEPLAKNMWSYYGPLFAEPASFDVYMVRITHHNNVTTKPGSSFRLTHRSPGRRPIPSGLPADGLSPCC